MDEQFIEDILENHEKKKNKVDGKAKGDRTERNLCKFLGKHFGEEFSKAPGSGARTSQVAYLPEHAKKTLTGDICVPEGFKWVIECKGGYEDDMNLTNVCEGVACLDEFIEQVTKDSEYCGRKPIIFWKRNRKPWLAILKIDDVPFKKPGVGYAAIDPTPCLETFILYKGWAILHLEALFEMTEKEFWFNETKNGMC